MSDLPPFYSVVCSRLVGVFCVYSVYLLFHIREVQDCPFLVLRPRKHRIWSFGRFDKDQASRTPILLEVTGFY